MRMKELGIKKIEILDAGDERHYPKIKRLKKSGRLIKYLNFLSLGVPLNIADVHIYQKIKHILPGSHTPEFLVLRYQKL